MTTKADRFKLETVRPKPRPPQKPKASNRWYQVDTSQPGVSATARRAGGESTSLRNRSLGHRASYALEDTKAPKRPSRKSTRKSSHRSKPDQPLRAKQQLKVSSPRARHLTRT